MTDRSRGYDAAADAFAAARSPVGLPLLRRWSASLPRGASVLDVGAGTGWPLTTALDRDGFTVFAVEASPRLAAVLRRNVPRARVACEAAERSAFFGRRFDAVVAVGLIFLLPDAAQRALIPRLAAALQPGGRLLLAAPAPPGCWDDVLTGLPSLSLGRFAYRRLLAEAGLTVEAERRDEGGNHYYAARRSAGTAEGRTGSLRPRRSAAFGALNATARRLPSPRAAT